MFYIFTMNGIHSKQKLFISFLFATCSITTIGQDRYSLSNCICIATIRNSQIKQAETDIQIAETVRDGRRNVYIPSLSLSNQNNLSIGRVLDPTTYQFVTNRTYPNSQCFTSKICTLFALFMLMSLKCLADVCILRTQS